MKKLFCLVIFFCYSVILYANDINRAVIVYANDQYESYSLSISSNENFSVNSIYSYSISGFNSYQERPTSKTLKIHGKEIIFFLIEWRKNNSISITLVKQSSDKTSTKTSTTQVQNGQINDNTCKQWLGNVCPDRSWDEFLKPENHKTTQKDTNNKRHFAQLTQEYREEMKNKYNNEYKIDVESIITAQHPGSPDTYIPLEFYYIEYANSKDQALKFTSERFKNTFYKGMDTSEFWEGTLFEDATIVDVSTPKLSITLHTE